MNLVGRRKDPENKEADIEMEIGWTAIQMYSIDKHLSQVIIEISYLIKLNSRRMEGYRCTLWIIIEIRFEYKKDGYICILMINIYLRYW